VVVDRAEVVAVPAALSDPEAATLPCAGVTAWSAVVTHGRVVPGSTVVTLGTGGVSLFALQLGKALGARVIATTSSDAKADRLRALGADAVVRYDQDPAWGRAIRRLTDGGADLVVEVGGAGTLAQSLDAVRVGGTVAVIGNLAGNVEPVSVIPILMRQVRVQGVFVGPRKALADLSRAVGTLGIRPVVDRVFPFDEAPAAFAWMDGRQHVGKVTIATPP
jgi:NADPH:quinone reductase-like Zn-dependent oxidoreductase